MNSNRDYDKYLKCYSEIMIEEPTYSEKVAKSVFFKNKVRFIQQAVIKTSIKGYIVDFLLPDVDAVIEIDGGYHNLPEQIKKDKARDRDLLNNGYRVYRIPNYFSKEELTEELLHILEKELGRILK